MFGDFEAPKGWFDQFAVWLIRKLRPSEGWAIFFLLWLTVWVMAQAVESADWVPEAVWVSSTATLALFVTIWVVKARIPRLRSLFYILAYGIVIIYIRAARLIPPWRDWFDWQAAGEHTRTANVLFLSRLNTWLATLFDGGDSSDTIAFTLLLLSFAWGLTAILTWMTFRHKRPLPALILIAIGLAFNDYFGQATFQWFAFYLGMVLFLSAVVRFSALETYWDANDIDYSEDLRNDLLPAIGVIASLLLVLSVVFSSLSIRTIARAFAQSPPVQAVEETLERMFGGVNAENNSSSGEGNGAAQAFGRGGILPRAYLIGNAPELYETTMFTATRTTVDGDLPHPPHWRALSFDVYTGRGWARSRENQRSVIAETDLTTVPSYSTQIDQTIHWVIDDRFARYTLGLPLRFDHDVSGFYRNDEDVSFVQGFPRTYSATSYVNSATIEQLESAEFSNIPPDIIERYTQLPLVHSRRVTDLAESITENEPNAYRQAKAIEQFLRQYEYSLDIEPPPDSGDVVEFFLFDLQKGYCDYYASAMVAMARSVGLPARLATGFVTSPLDENGVETVLQVNGHSWAEVYFAEFGWVEFEPTATFSIEPPPTDLVENEEVDSAETATPPPIPEQSGRFGNWLGLLALVFGGMAVGAGTLVWQSRPSRQSISERYDFLLKSAPALSVDASVAQTPLEFNAAWLQKLDQIVQAQAVQSRPRLKKWVEALRSGVHDTIHTYNETQYAENDETVEELVLADDWPKHRRTIWLLRLLRLGGSQQT